ncbi:protein phosphatase 1 regulatory subunit 14B-like [Watersipora subatra]|uniref:protein phosphatase 1 regulatory subunit 14B-like n=1 Tax=Watersipora subatra TaxID=2589382 RepID=UPI00355BE8D6
MSEAVEICHSTSVKFADEADGSLDCSCNSERETEKKRNLTMKYGLKQRHMVQKRIRVEDWIDSQLKVLYGIEDPNDTYPCDPDLDELLNEKDEGARREKILELLKPCKQSEATIQGFVDELMEKMKELP